MKPFPANPTTLRAEPATRCAVKVELQHWHGEWKARLAGEIEWARFRAADAIDAKSAARYHLQIPPGKPVEFTIAYKIQPIPGRFRGRNPKG